MPRDHPADHAPDVRIDRRHWTSEGDGRHGPRRVWADAGQILKRGQVIGHRPAVPLDDGRRGSMQSDRATVVAEPRPRAHGIGHGSGRQRGRRGEAAGEAHPRDLDTRDLRLLEHDFRHEHPPRVAGRAERQVPTVEVVPREQRRRQADPVPERRRLHRGDTDTHMPTEYPPTDRLAQPRLRIAQVAPPVERVPPLGYGGTERVIDELARELARRGHEVVLFASGDSDAPGELVETVPVSLRTAGTDVDPAAWLVATELLVLRRQSDFDVIHAHLEFHNLVLARAATRPVIGTFHGRLDGPAVRIAFADRPQGLVAISRAQADELPHVPWAGIVHNGLTLRDMPFSREPGEELCFVGRITPDKGIVAAIEVARLSGRTLRIAAKEPWLPVERQYNDEVFLPATKRAHVELLGELGQADRDALMAGSFATLMPSVWPEPFGLVAIESMACGTPVVCRPVGALPEIVRDGIDGFFGDDAQAMAATLDGVAALDRAEIRRSVLERFSAEHMADGYEAVYAAAVAGTPGTNSGPR